MGYQVIYIAKPHPTCSIEQLTHIGYYESLDKSPVVITVGEAIARINLNEYEFFVSVAQQKHYLTIAGNANGLQYLKTNSDPTLIDKLLQLNELFENRNISEEVSEIQNHTEYQHNIDISSLLPSSTFKGIKLWPVSYKKSVQFKIVSIIGFILSLIK